MKLKSEIITILLGVIILLCVFFISYRSFLRNKILHMDDISYKSVTLDQVFFARAFHIVTKENPKLTEKEKLVIIESIYNASVRHKESPYLYLAIAKVESGFRLNIVGKHGEIGLFQPKPWIAKKYLPVFSVKELKKILKFAGPNTNAATGYFSDLKKKFKQDLIKTIEAYNCGPKQVRNKKVPQETKEYATRVLQCYHNFNVASSKL